ncbi:MAG: CHAT domain-containing protein [Bacteroidetes bacterium]|jgi:CHAT domain-containing protein|nr:CHAT domain-containing protein [Bacteroidota bacterium]MCA6445313.1 CHAT domain-containing protein [Bacteroidota bacterium]
MKLFITGALISISSFCFTQTFGEKLRKKLIDDPNSKIEKSKTQYDETNFNFVISLTDNCSLFETEEEGSGFMSGVSNLLNGGIENSENDVAYRNLKSGEMFLAKNQHFLAEQSFLQALRTYTLTLDTSKQNVNYEQTLSNLGVLYQTRGMFTKALPYLEKSLYWRKKGNIKGMQLVSMNNIAVFKKETGSLLDAEKDLKDCIEYAKGDTNSIAKALIHNNLAMVYVDMNKLEDAEKNILLATYYSKKTLKTYSENAIKFRINLCNIYRLRKKYTEAESLLQDAISQRESKLSTYSDLAFLKKSLAQLYIEMGNLYPVEGLLKSAYDINKRKLGAKNPATLSSLQELGNYYRITKNNTQALECLNKVVNDKKEVYGETHPNYIQALEDYAMCLWFAKDFSYAKGKFNFVIDNTLNYINTFFKSLNDNEKTLYWEKTNLRLQNYFSFTIDYTKQDSSILTDLYNTIINTKGFLLNNSSKIRSAIASSDDVSLKQTYKKWLEVNENLNAAYQLSVEERKNEKVNVDSLKERISELEKELSLKSEIFKESINTKKIELKDVQVALKPNEAAIELIQLNAIAGSEMQASYKALVIKSGSIRLVDLGLFDSVNVVISNFRDCVINQKPEPPAYAKTWKPVDLEIKNCSKIYISSDGAFHQLSINSLKDSANKYVIDKYTITFVGNTKDIIEVKKNLDHPSKPNNAFLVGNPYYGESGSIEQLPGTEKEVINITKQLNALKVKTKTVIGKNATETEIKKIQSPSILHIATHGYFLADLSKMEANKVLGVDLNSAKENPLLRSGLMFANADNVFKENYKSLNNQDNGVLTAFEALSLNLEKTDLVVLSACETGLGSVKQGEGVYGLQRAFLIAGAKSIIMSLWEVSDDATMDLMTSFYASYSANGDKTTAFNNAIKLVKTKYKDPFYWGAFVMLNK